MWMENLDYKNENIKRKYLKKYGKQPIFRVRKRSYGIEGQIIDRQRRKN